MREKLTELGWKTMIRLAYSGHIVPFGYHLFHSLPHVLVNKNMVDVIDVMDVINQFIALKPAEFFKKGIENLPEHWKTMGALGIFGL